MIMFVVFHSREVDGKIRSGKSLYFGKLHRMKTFLLLLLAKIPESEFLNMSDRGGAIFLVALENENVCSFPLKSGGWKDLMREKPVFWEAPQDEKFSAIAPGENS